MSSIKINKEFLPETKYIIATPSSTESIANTNLSLNTIYDSVGDFTLTDKAIIIPNGIKKVRVSGAIFIDNPGSTGYLWGMIVLNDAKVTGQILGTIRGGYDSITIPSIILNVKEGDKIYLYLNNTTGQGTTRVNNANTFLMVEEVK